MYLDKMIETVGAEPMTYDQKVTCCGGALAFSEPDKSPEADPRHRRIRLRRWR